MQKVLEKKVLDYIIPIEEYPKIHHDSSIYDAIIMLENSRKNHNGNYRSKHPLLVVDDNDRVIGKVGPLCCLKALNPEFCMDFDDIEKIKRLEEFHSDFLETLLCKKIFDQFSIMDKSNLASETKVINVMYSISESIEGSASVFLAINKIVNLNTMSILVTNKSTVIGLVHLFDLYNAIAVFVKSYKAIN